MAAVQDAPPETPLDANGGDARGVIGRPEALEVERAPAEIRLDGAIDESAWAAVDPLPMTTYAPTFGAPLSEMTEVRVTYDDEYLYVSGRMFDSSAEGPRTNTLYRDQFSGDDLMAVIVDSFNDYETALWFITNPAGSRTDRTVSNDAVSSNGSAMNADWNAHWDVATSQTDEGWFAEFRIPFSTLGFQDVDGEVTMGLIIYRFIGRLNERQLFPAIEPKWGGLGFAKPSQAQRIVLKGVRRSKPIYVTPYTLGGAERFPRLVGDGDTRRFETDSDPSREIGLDVKYPVSSNLTIDVTVNTDFSQVEVDDQQVNLTRFSLFFPEKRQFFQERSSTFDYNLGGQSTLFHSRQIGLVDGDFTRIYGGVRAVGRAGGLDFGVLTMQTADHADRPGENMAVARVSQQVFNEFSSVGAMLTSRLGSHGQDNVAYGLDALVRPFGDEYVSVKWAQTFDEEIDERNALSQGFVRAEWERRTDEGFTYNGSFTRTGADFDPRLGFQRRDDFTRLGADLQYKRFLGALSPFRSVAFETRTGHFYGNAGFSPESRNVTPQISLEFKGGTQLDVGAESTFESVENPFDISDAEIAVGDYWFHEGTFRLQLPRSDFFRGDFSARAGTFYDGTRVSLTANPTWTLSEHLELGGGYTINRLRFDERGEETTIHQARLRTQVALDTHLSMNVFAQFNNTDDLATVNARLRYHFREGTDLWIVFNEGVNTSRLNGVDPRLPFSAGRTFTFKYNHVLIW